ncbi:MAG: hypothetical protein CFH36_01276 [Alphaproteobacteria bacterium MarineAlpha9_Bin6]|nr:MAG: hypothetical protein CFH36_01276 [Alphaproteobacteria bacterium MarineAlpha9_Bin6]
MNGARIQCAAKMRHISIEHATEGLVAAPNIISNLDQQLQLAPLIVNC